MAPATLSRNERFKQGKALRRQAPRAAHAELKGTLSRSSVAILAESDRDRVPELVPERYARMSLNPFAFLRGAAAVMATDLAAQPMAGIPVHAFRGGVTGCSRRLSSGRRSDFEFRPTRPASGALLRRRRRS